MNNNYGKATITILILGILILVALVPWFFVITNFFGLELFSGEDNDYYEEHPPVINDSEQDPYVTPDYDNEPDDEEPYEPDEEIQEPDEPADNTNHNDDASIANVEMVVRQLSAEHSEIYDELTRLATAHNAVSAALVVFDGDAGEYYTFEFGFADRDTRRRVDDQTKFRVASLTKLVTAIAVLTLYDDGLIDLDADISRYFGFEVRNANFPETPLTSRMLLQHTSSLFDSGAFQVSRDRGSSDSVRVLLERGTSFRRNQPGSTFEYSNFGYAVLSALAERVTGKTLDALAREVIFEPLGIDAAYVAENLQDTENIAVIYNDSHGITRTVESQLNVRETGTPGHDLHLAQGNLYISLLDYARILAMLGNGGSLDGVRILSSAAVREMHNADVQGRSYAQGLATRFSVGDFISGEGFFWHTGSAYGTFAQYVYHEDRNQGVVVVTIGASISRLANGMVDVCTYMARAALRVFGFAGENQPDEIDYDYDYAADD
ncbi:MAG: beta-lactamase family protein [Oscillospiraceae bacterium]|nr:beta-lactamase family protein [Oscillospiraceae bacterium]MCL2278090.1 beta-lactamase family protein [Oscillospiraceae bacterium]